MKKKTKTRVEVVVKTFVDDKFRREEICHQFIWEVAKRSVIVYGGQRLEVNLIDGKWVAERKIRTLRAVTIEEIFESIRG